MTDLQRLANEVPRRGSAYAKARKDGLERLEREIERRARLEALALWAREGELRDEREAKERAALAARPFRARLADWWRARPWR